MKHLAAYLLLQLGGNETPSKEDVTKALSTVGVEVDSARLDKLLADLEGKNVAELLDTGKELLAKFGGGGGGGAAAEGGAAPEAAAAAVVEEKEEEVEMDLGGGMDMFGGDEGGGGGGDY
jgi:large subunit ribosomal protein LP2